MQTNPWSLKQWHKRFAQSLTIMEKTIQNVTHENIAPLLSPNERRVYGVIVISLFLTILTGAISIPFVFESSSMLYKFGTDKILLRSGKILGLIASCLMILQCFLSARFKFLDRIFALNNLMNAHRINGMIIAGCVLVHPVLIFIPEDMTSLPLSLRYWPEFAGFFLLIVIWGIVITAVFRQRLKIAFDRWRFMHQWAALTSFICLFVHVLFVSETFDKGLPRLIVYCVIGIYAILFLRTRLNLWLIRKKPFSVSEANPVAMEAFCLKIAPDSGKPFSYLPGQFGFISITSDAISSEAHPFSFASSPSRPNNLEFIIRTRGDWVRNIGDIKSRDRVYVDGPYGLFTHIRCDLKQELIMIAGGIGITPLLSMLRFLSDAKDTRKIILIWSNRTREHIIHTDEFSLLEKKLPGLQIHHIFTDRPPGNENIRKLDKPELKRLLKKSSRQSPVFLCGPPLMMKNIRNALIELGFSRKIIFTERFAI